MGALADAGRWHRERLGGGGRRRVPLRQAAANNGCGAYYDHPEHGTSCAGGCCVSPGESDVPRLQVRCWLSLVAHPGPQALWCQLPALVPAFDDASHIGSSGFCDATAHTGLRRGASSFFFARRMCTWVPLLPLSWRSIFRRCSFLLLVCPRWSPNNELEATRAGNWLP